MHRVFRYLLFVLLPLVAIITIGVIAGQAGGVVSHTAYGFNWTAFMAQLSAAAAYNITYAGYVSDYSRYLPASTPRGEDHRLRVRGRVHPGDLADRAGRLAGHPARRHRRSGRPADRGKQRGQRTWAG